MFLKRECAGKTNFLAVVVYTREAYIADPDMTPEGRAKRSSLECVEGCREAVFVDVSRQILR